jgi:xanthine dehydrogenase YagR molybdenum-binding subunit
MTTATAPVSVGSARPRLDGVAKVTGQARYAAEFRIAGRAYGSIVQATIARGRIVSVNTDRVRKCPGVIDVLTHASAPRLHPIADTAGWLLQDDRVHYRGQVVALVVAETLEQAQAAAADLHIDYDTEPADVILRPDHPTCYTPELVNPDLVSETHTGDVDAAFGQAAFAVDQWYATPAEHTNPMEPHAATAYWDNGRLIVHDSNQGSVRIQSDLAALFGRDAAGVQVVAEHIGGGFGSKASIRPPAVLAAMASKVTGRAVTVAATRRQIFSIVGYRSPSLQHLRLGADESGRLVCIDHLSYAQTSQIFEYAEETALPSRMMYATPNVRTGHRLIRLDVPTTRWMRAPGYATGSFALESAMDELAEASGIDPVELRIRNDTDHEAEGGAPFTSRSYVQCLREGAERFGWASRDPRPGLRRDGRWLIGTGMASSAYPAGCAPSTATATARRDGTFVVEIAASDIGTGARTVLTQISADALGVSPSRVQLRIGDSDSGDAVIAGLSLGTASWGWAALKACSQLAAQLDGTPATEVAVRADTSEEIKAQDNLARYSFGAQFVQARVDPATGEVRVDRMTGVFAAGRIINPTTARSQFIGGMTMGLGMALHEAGVMDPQFGDYVNNDLAGYHVAAHADVPAIEIGWINEHDTKINPLGVKGIGELGIVGTAAAIANAVWHATGVRCRTLPLTPDRVLRGHSTAIASCGV